MISCLVLSLEMAYSCFILCPKTMTHPQQNYERVTMCRQCLFSSVLQYQYIPALVHRLPFLEESPYSCHTVDQLLKYCEMYLPYRNGYSMHVPHHKAVMQLINYLNIMKCTYRIVDTLHMCLCYDVFHFISVFFPVSSSLWHH